MIQTKKRPDPDAFSKNSERVVWEKKDGSKMTQSYLSGKYTKYPAKKKRC